jgi:putative sterol carrier protein
LEPIMRSIARWAARSPAWPFTRPVSVNSFVLSLRTVFDAEAAENLDAGIELWIGKQRFRARIEDKRMELAPGVSASADAVFEGDQNALSAVIYGGRRLGDAEAAGTIAVRGDRALAERFVTLFRRPARAPVTAAT